MGARRAGRRMAHILSPCGQHDPCTHAAPCAGLQSRQFPAHAGDAGRGLALAADRAQLAAGAPCALRCVPVRRGSPAACGLSGCARSHHRPGRAADYDGGRMIWAHARSSDKSPDVRTGASWVRRYSCRSQRAAAFQRRFRATDSAGDTRKVRMSLDRHRERRQGTFGHANGKSPLNLVQLEG